MARAFSAGLGKGDRAPFSELLRTQRVGRVLRAVRAPAPGDRVGRALGDRVVGVLTLLPTGPPADGRRGRLRRPRRPSAGGNWSRTPLLSPLSPSFLFFLFLFSPSPSLFPPARRSWSDFRKKIRNWPKIFALRAKKHPQFFLCRFRGEFCAWERLPATAW